MSPPEATVQHVLDAVGVKKYGTKVLYKGTVLSKDAPLSDVGVGAEALISVAWKKLTDIQMLFEIFGAKEDTHRALGYETYAEFEEAVPFPEGAQQVDFLSSKGVVVQFHDGLAGSVESIVFSRNAVQEIQRSMINWDAVQEFANLQILVINHFGISGSVSFDKLPDKLETLSLYGNKLSGNVNFNGIPNTLTELNLGFNKFSGSIDFSPLPRGMVRLNLRHNLFTGTIDPQTLPPALVGLFLDGNRLEGTYHASKFPVTLTSVGGLELDPVNKEVLEEKGTGSSGK